MLVDTGSAVPLVREDVFRDVTSGNSLTMEVPANSVVAANWETLDIIGQCTMSIKVRALSKEYLVLVARNLKQECLLEGGFYDKVGLYCSPSIANEGPVPLASPPKHGIQCSPVCFHLNLKCPSILSNVPSCQGVTNEQLEFSPCGTSVAVYGPTWCGLLVAHTIIDAAAI